MSSPLSPTKNGGEANTLGKMVIEADAQRAVKHQAKEEARQIRSKEMERIRQEEDDEESKGLPNNKSTRNCRQSSHEPSPPTSLDSSHGQGQELRELRQQLSSLSAKFKEAMFTNAQLDNEKQTLRYQVDLLTDKVDDISESKSTLQKDFNTKKKEFSYQKMQVDELRSRIDWQTRQIEARDTLIVEHGLVLMGASEDTCDNTSNHLPASSNGIAEATASSLPIGGGGRTNGSSRETRGVSVDSDASSTTAKGMALLSKDTAVLLNSLPAGDLESRVRHLFTQRDQLQGRVERLDTQLEEERQRADVAAKYDSRNANGPDSDDLRHNMQTTRAQAQDYKLQLQRTSQKVTALEGEIIRLEGQVKRYKAIAESCEKQEEELKQEKRKMQRDLRDAQSKIEDLKSENGTLQRKFDKLKTSHR